MEERRMDIQANLSLAEAKDTVLQELTRPVTQGKHVSISNKSNKENNTNDGDNKWNNNTEETAGNVHTNNTVLELSESATNTKDVANNKNKDNNTKTKKQDNTNDIENKNNKGAEETMAST